MLGTKKMVNAFGEEIKLTDEQRACIEYKGIKVPNLTIKGAAGAGKSVVIMGIAKKLLDEYSAEKKNRCVVFTYNNTLAASMRELLDKNGDKSDYIKISTFDSYIVEVFNSMPGHPSMNIVYEKARPGFMRQALENHKKTFGEHRLNCLDISFWLEEIKWMKDMNISDGDISDYLVLPRAGRGSTVRMSAKDRLIAFQIFKEYNAVLKSKHCCEWEDIRLFVTHNTSKIPDRLKYDYVLVDEAQDMSLAKMVAAVALHREKMIFAMDMNQRLYNQNWTIKQLGISSMTKKLTKSFRCTKQIDALAESLRKNNDGLVDEDDKSLHVIPDAEGELPQIVKLSNSVREQQYVTELAKQWMQDNAKITVGILASNNNQCDLYSQWLANAGIKHEVITAESAKEKKFSITKPGIKVATIYSAKGLEFVRVIIPQFVEGKMPRKIKTTDQEFAAEEMVKARNLAYVGLTRAMKSLVITYSDTQSRFIREMDSDLYDFNDLSVNHEAKVKKTIKGDDDSPILVVKKIPKANVISLPKKQNDDSLKDFFANKGLEVIDKREYGGCLWVVGDEQKIGAIVKEAKSRFHAGGNFGAGKATNYRRSWFTHCKR